MNLDQSWNLSLVGNRNSITQNATAQNRTHGPTHELLTVASQSVTHDAKGNMTLIPAVLRPGSDPLKMKWDFENKPLAADSDNVNVDDVFDRFDAIGRRVSRDDGTANVVKLPGRPANDRRLPIWHCRWQPDLHLCVCELYRQTSDARRQWGLRYFHGNQQYSITALTDGSGSVVERYAYTAYGQVTFANGSGTVQAASASNNRYTYTGREWDEDLSLYHYRARMYDAVAGRFVSRDPSGYKDGNSLYEIYIGLSLLDPEGLQSINPYAPGIPIPVVPKPPINPCVAAFCGSCGAMLGATVAIAYYGCNGDQDCTIGAISVVWDSVPGYTQTAIVGCVGGCGLVACSYLPGHLKRGCAVLAAIVVFNAP